MSKNEEIQTVKVEFVAPDNGLKPNPVDVVKQLVEQHIAEIMANKDVWLFQPFLQTKRVSDEIRRMQTVPEQRMWSLYFARWGCVYCHKKADSHRGCGFCDHCYGMMTWRLKQIKKATGRRSETPDFDILDEVEAAQRALGGNRKALTAKSVRQTRVR